MDRSDQDRAHYPPQSPAATGLRGRCPRCGDGRLFDGFLTVAPACGACGLDYSFADSGDGPAVFVILIVGFIVAGGALFLEFSVQPPYWVHAVIWVPLVLVLSLVMLRALKGLMIALQYRHQAGEGQIGRG
jgi:uncharacterized protein (DUF983 family)